MTDSTPAAPPPAGWRASLARAAARLMAPSLSQLQRQLSDAAAYDDSERFQKALDETLAAYAREKAPFKSPEALCQAISFGRVNHAKALLDAGCDPSEPFRQSRPLRQAIELRDPAALSLLLSRGADPSARDSFGQTPLSAACERGLIHHARALIAAGADPCALDSNGSSPLARAFHTANGSGRDDPHTLEGALLCAEALLDAGARPLESRLSGLSPVALAASLGFEALAHRLLASEPDPSAWLERALSPQPPLNPDAAFFRRAMSSRAQAAPLGGSTPSPMPAPAIAALLDRARALAESQALMAASQSAPTPGSPAPRKIASRRI